MIDTSPKTRDTTREVRLMRLARETEINAPDCVRCGHAFLAHDEKAGCLHTTCASSGGSACRKYKAPRRRSRKTVT